MKRAEAGQATRHRMGPSCQPSCVLHVGSSYPQAELRNSILSSWGGQHQHTGRNLGSSWSQEGRTQGGRLVKAPRTLKSYRSQDRPPHSGRVTISDRGQTQSLCSGPSGGILPQRESLGFGRLTPASGFRACSLKAHPLQALHRGTSPILFI